jgi:5'-methylthioadenosine phosphorylase
MKFGIIGGSGVYDAGNIQNLREISVSTPFGNPSDKLTTGKIGGIEFAFLPRHGKGHRILPGELNHKANIFAMKKIGVTHILSISAVGSLQSKYKPRDIVVVDQYFDRTKKGLEHTFFGNGIAAHVSMGHPVCPELAELAYKAASASVNEIHGSNKKRPKVHKGGTYLNMEGPAFSTKAESMVFRSWGMDVIGMTNIGEAKLSREAEICYCTLAMVTDYDCWHPDHDHVTVDMIIQNLVANSGIAKNIISRLPEFKGILEGKCSCGSALACAIITAKDKISAKSKKDLAPIIGKYIK